MLERLEERVGLSRGDLLGLAIALLGCVVATVVAFRVPLLAHLAPDDPTQTSTATEAADHTEPGEPGSPLAGPLVVHIAGAVVSPGVIELRTGDRVADALAAAGGPLPDASLASLNLARPLVDGEQVLVPTTADAALGGEGTGTGSGPGSVGPSTTLPDGRLDLNSATASDLEELPGVGPVLAGRIVAHRDQHGPFAEVSQLREVSGIGEAKWATLRDLVGVR